jgi:hypothetical protein
MAYLLLSKSISECQKRPKTWPKETYYRWHTSKTYSTTIYPLNLLYYYRWHTYIPFKPTTINGIPKTL